MRMSVTDLDAYRYYKASDDMDVEALLRRLRKEEPPSIPMIGGRALHKVLEHAGEGELATAEADGFKFKFDVNAEIPALPVRELKGEMTIVTPVALVTLVGIIDGHDGAVHDWKMTERFDAERYADSYQWRCYLTMFAGRQFVYHAFEARLGDDDTWTVYGYHRLPLFAYEGMQDDVRREVTDFAQFLAVHMPERLLKEAA